MKTNNSLIKQIKDYLMANKHKIYFKLLNEKKRYLFFNECGDKKQSPKGNYFCYQTISCAYNEVCELQVGIGGACLCQAIN